MKSHYKVVVIGGGVVGTAILYHLAKYGWTDTLLVERNVLTSGSSWHAAGGFHALNSNPNVATLHAYTIDLLSEVEKESGVNISMHTTGGISYACNPDRWDALKASIRVFQSTGIDDVRLIGVDEILERCPIVKPDGIIGGLFAEREGHIDPSAVVHAYARAAKNRGASIVEKNRVLELNQRPDKSWDVVTEQGTINAEHVVNAGGLWAKQVGRMAGLELPVSPLEHMYLVTEAIPEVAKLGHELPTMVDLDGFSYLRQEQKGILIGIYETDHRHWNMDGAPWDYGFDLIQEDPDRIEHELTLSYERYPVLAEAGIKRWVNGAFTFTPDGNPLVGPVRGKDNYWVACGVMAGFMQGGGVGKALAEWMILGEPEDDIFGMDIARYGQHASNRQYIKETTGQFYSRRFVMSYPNEQLPAGRPLKVSPSYDQMTEAGARWGVSWGLEVPLYFAPKDYVENPTLRRSSAFDIVGAEVRHTREKAGLIDISGYSRYEVKGPQAQAWLDHVFACKIPKPGRSVLAPMLAPNGKLKGDLTIFNWGDGSYWIMGSYYLREWHMRWFESHLSEGVEVSDISDTYVGFSLCGPLARKVLERTTADDVSNEGFKFLACRTIDVGLIRAKVGRMSVTGEMGYEINCHASQHRSLRETLLKAGADLGLKEVGFGASLSMRLEKSYGIWSREFTQGYTPQMTLFDRFIDFTKPDFIGRDAALREKETQSARQLQVTLEVDATNADASGYEPILKDGKLVGYVTSGGYGHTIGKSLAMALIDRELAVPGTELTTFIVGDERACRVIPASPYDPEGKVLRM
ncbi:GcvT family protein [Rhizobium alvei]|uniref:FAD-dependent oxidoreductase n=1 Tax=Rhizobium alvei TaxID=1132659 RepID=A0ABT8YFQ1_9HYPH|nr:FAD-dependent oxidoreductase [Rhizobium alvei]MDO6962517.1 FAD-dependent oxidoreductase [Rhizobium alvei]